ncbi:MAG: biopolymer transporter ExbD [Planctomycetes bacterium]|nr:biopolymer transporter ExbD [Planctomycetota bacterium]
MHDPAEAAADGKIDLVPMIDCVMLLLLFFILTTKFTADEKQLAALLPTNQGQGIPSETPPVIPPKDINLVVTPTGISRGLKEVDYQHTWNEIARLRGRTPPAAALRIGGSDPLLLDGSMLSSPDKAAVQRQVDAIHAYVAQELAAREEAGDRTVQSPVHIHCFSGLSWGYALVIYDAVRAYEAQYQPTTNRTTSVLADGQRTVSFAPPRLRNHTVNGSGRELWELTNLQ